MIPNLIQSQSHFTIFSINLLWASSKIVSGKFSLVDHSRDFGVVEIVTVEGVRGYSELYASLYTDFYTLSNILATFAKKLHKTSFSNPSELQNHLRMPFLSRSGIHYSVVSAIEMASWDVFAKINENCFQSLASTSYHNTFKIYGSGGSNLMSPVQVEQEYLQSSQFFDGYKFRIGLRDLATDLSKIDLVSSAATYSNAVWMIDSIAETRSEVWDLEKCSRVILSCLEGGATWFEEPFRVDQVIEYSHITEAFPKFIAAGESLCSQFEIRSLAAMRNLGWLQLDVTHNSSISHLFSLFQGIDAIEAKLALHCWGSLLAFRQSFFTALLLPIDWIEKPLIQYEIDSFFPNPSIHDSSILPTECVDEMIIWLKKMDRFKRFDVKVDD